MDIISNGTAEGTIIYQYTPSEGAGWAFVVLFAITTVTHVVLMFWHRTWYFLWMILGGIMQAGSYYGRVWSHSEPKNFKAYVLYLLLNLGSIPFIAATIYVALSRIITTLEAPTKSIVKPNWLTGVFVCVDIITLVSQLAGAGMRCSISASMQETGRKVVIGGLIFQIICFVLFVLIAFKFHQRFGKTGTALAADSAVNWGRHLVVLYMASSFILVRNIFKLAEYTQGHTGLIAHTETLVYVFDATLVWLVTFIYVLIHPGMLVRYTNRAKKSSGFTEQRGLTEIQEMGIRPWS